MDFVFEGEFGISIVCLFVNETFLEGLGEDDVFEGTVEEHVFDFGEGVVR